MIYLLWALFGLLAAICIGYGLFIEKHFVRRLVAFGIGVVCISISTALDYLAVNWFGY